MKNEFELYNPSSAKCGNIYAANDANFDAAHLSQPLTEFATGLTERNELAATLELIAPSVPCGRSFSYKIFNEKLAYVSDAANDADIREIGGDFATVTGPSSSADGRTDNKGLILVIDNDDGGEIPRVQQRAIASLTRRLLGSEIRRVLALLEANDVNGSALTPNWGSGNSARNPDADLLAQIELSGTLRGANPNIILCGSSAAVKRKSALLGTSAPAAGGLLMLTDEQLASWYGVDRFLTLDTVYQSAISTKSRSLGDAIFVYHAAPNPMLDDPSNIKRFVTETAEGPLRAYVWPERKRTLLCVEHYSRIVCTSTLGILKIAPTYTA